MIVKAVAVFMVNNFCRLQDSNKFSVNNSMNKEKLPLVSYSRIGLASPNMSAVFFSPDSWPDISRKANLREYLS